MYKGGKIMLSLSVLTISTFVGLLNQCVKQISETTFKKDITRYIPLFSLGFGIILGIVGYFAPGVDMGDNIIEAFFIGLSAGAASTGVHQVGKQLGKEPSDVEEVGSVEYQEEDNEEEKEDDEWN